MKLIIDSTKNIYEMISGTLFYSELDRSWRTPGKEAAKIYEEGDLLVMEINGRILRLDHSEAREMGILLGEYFEDYSVFEGKQRK